MVAFFKASGLFIFLVAASLAKPCVAEDEWYKTEGIKDNDYFMLKSALNFEGFKPKWYPRIAGTPHNGKLYMQLSADEFGKLKGNGWEGMLITSEKLGDQHAESIKRALLQVAKGVEVPTFLDVGAGWVAILSQKLVTLPASIALAGAGTLSWEVDKKLEPVKARAEDLLVKLDSNDLYEVYLAPTVVSGRSYVVQMRTIRILKSDGKFDRRFLLNYTVFPCLVK